MPHQLPQGPLFSLTSVHSQPLRCSQVSLTVWSASETASIYSGPPGMASFVSRPFRTQTLFCCPFQRPHWACNIFFLFLFLYLSSGFVGFVLLFSFFFFFSETVSHYIALPCLELIMMTRLALNLQRSDCFCLQSTGLKICVTMPIGCFCLFFVLDKVSFWSSDSSVIHDITHIGLELLILPQSMEHWVCIHHSAWYFYLIE